MTKGRGFKSMLACEAINRDERKVREMLVTNRIELIFFDRPFEMNSSVITPFGANSVRSGK
jgi:hypothetical protein